MTRRLAAGLVLAALLVGCRRAEPTATSSGTTPANEAPTATVTPTGEADRGVTFRASGIEPGWYVEVIGGDQPSRLVLLWDYDSNRLDSRDVTRSDSGAVLTFAATDGQVTATVRAERTPCAEPGSGGTAYTVTVQVGAQTLHGCGHDQ